MPKNERVTKADLARIANKSPAAVGQQLRRHGIIAGKDGLVSKAAALEAMAVGATLDKNRAKEQLEKLESRGDRDSLLVKGKMATLRRIILQGDLLEIERDKAKGELIPLADHKAQLIEMQNVCMRLWDTWIEAIGSKRKDAALIEEMRKGRDQVLGELVAVIDG